MAYGQKLVRAAPRHVAAKPDLAAAIASWNNGDAYRDGSLRLLLDKGLVEHISYPSKRGWVPTAAGVRAGLHMDHLNEARGHHVADFNTLDDLIAHARDELGATHVLVADANTKLYFPRGGQHSYEEASVWRKAGYWHAQGPGARTGVRSLPEEAQPIGGGRAERRAAEAPHGAAPQLTERLRATMAWVIEDWPYPYRGSAEGDMNQLIALGLVTPHTDNEWGNVTPLGRQVWAGGERAKWIEEWELGAAYKRSGMTRTAEAGGHHIAPGYPAERFRIGQDVAMISNPTVVGHVVGFDPDGSVMVQWHGGRAVSGVDARNLRGLPPGYAGRRATEARHGGSASLRRQQRAGSFVVTLSTGQTARFHDMPRAEEWATSRLTGQPAGTYAAFYRAAVGPGRSDTGAPWTEPFYMLIVDEYGHIRVGDTRTVAPLPAQHPHRSIGEARSVRDYIAIDRRGKTIAGPFKHHYEAEKAAGPAGVVQFVSKGGRTSEARRPGGTRGGPARKYYVVDQMQGTWVQVGHFATRQAAEHFKKQVPGKTRIVHTWPDAHDYPIVREASEPRGRGRRGTEARVRLSNGTTINDVYAALVNGLGEETDEFRNITRDQLRDVIHAAGLRYEEASRLTVSLAWAQGQSDNPMWKVDAGEVDEAPRGGTRSAHRPPGRSPSKRRRAKR